MHDIKILHIITKLELGGAQINTVHTVNNLGKVFTVYLLSGEEGKIDNRVINKSNHFHIKELIRNINPLKDFIALIKIIKLIKKLNPDIVHTHSSKAGILGRIAAKISKVPVIIHSVHGFAFSPNNSKLKNLLFTKIEKMISGITNHFIFVAKADVKTAIELKIITQNYSLIRSGFPFEKFTDWKGNLEEIRMRYGISKNAFICGIIAPFKPQKGLFHLLEIAEKVIEKLKDTIFIIAGDGDLREELENRIKKKALENNFILPGFIEDIHNFIAICDIGVSTALWEGLPQSLVQMRLMKKAVVVSDIAGNIEIIKNGLNGFTVDVKNYSFFAEKIIQLLENKKLRNKMENFHEDLSKWEADNMVKEQEILYKSFFVNKSIN